MPLWTSVYIFALCLPPHTHHPTCPQKENGNYWKECFTSFMIWCRKKRREQRDSKVKPKFPVRYLNSYITYLCS